MKLPAELFKCKEWCLVGPMGPHLPKELSGHSVIAVDGGARFCTNPLVWIGDGDSIIGPMSAEHIFQYPPKKSLSDLALALSMFENKDSLILHLWGFLGGRRDHELLNFGEVLRFLEAQLETEVNFYDSAINKSVRCFSTGRWNFNHHGTFTLISMRTIKVRIEGSCEYTLNEETELAALSTLGLSNSASGNFSIYTDGPIMVIFPESE